MTTENSAIAETAAQLLKQAKQHQANGWMSEAALATVRPIENAMRFAHYEWSYGDDGLVGGGDAPSRHPRYIVPADAITDAVFAQGANTMIVVAMLL